MEKFLRFPISGSTYQLVSATNIALIQQATATTTTIAYKSSSTGTDILTITHASVANDDFRDFVQNQVLSALETSWTNVALTVDPPVAVTSIAIA
jgi:hypothetical protein